MVLSAGEARAEDLYAEEPKLMHSLGSRAERQAGVLTLHTRGGDVSFRDISCEVTDANSCMRHRLVAYDPNHAAYAVRRNYYEGYDYEWVSETTGISVRIAGLPNYSPSGRTFVVVEANEAYSFNGIQVWRTESGKAPALEWQYSPADHRRHELYQFVRWDGDDTVQLRVEIWRDRQLMNFEAQLVRRGGDWNVEVLNSTSR